MNASEGIKRVMMLIAITAGFFLSYIFHQDPIGNVHFFSSVEAFASFTGLGALCGVLIWLPIKYVLKGFTPKAKE